MNIFKELLAGAIEATIDAVEKRVQREAQRAREALNRRIGPVPQGRAPLDRKLEEAKRRAQRAELDEFEQRRPSPHDDAPPRR